MFSLKVICFSAAYIFKKFPLQHRQQAKSISSSLEITFPKIKNKQRNKQTKTQNPYELYHLKLKLRTNTLCFQEIFSNIYVACRWTFRTMQYSHYFFLTFIDLELGSFFRFFLEQKLLIIYF